MPPIPRLNTTDYNLRNIPDPLWSAARAKAERQGRTMRETILLLLADWVDKRGIPDQIDEIRRESRTT